MPVYEDDTDLDNKQPQTSKRPRPVVSCLACRQRKLKCDRHKPCQKCIKAGRRDECAYAPGQEPIPDEGKAREHQGKRRRISTHSEPTTTVDLTKFNDLQDRVQQLEKALNFHSRAAAEPVSHPSRAVADTVFASTDAVIPSSDVGERITVRRHLKIIDQFDAVKDFVDKLESNATSQEFANIASDIQNMMITTYRHPTRYITRILPDIEILEISMEKLLPLPAVCLKLVDLYFDYFEICTRILHRGTSRTMLRAHLTGSAVPDKHSTCLPMLLAVVSIASSLGIIPECYQPELNSYGGGAGAYHLLRNYLDMVPEDEWSVTENLQIAALTLRYHQSCGLSETQKWQWSGVVLRHAMAAGIDQCDDLTDGIFQAELRRRLYLTILEYDLASAIASSLPANCPRWQSQLPLHIDDSQIYPGIVARPVELDREEWSESLCSHHLAMSFNDRLAAYNQSCHGPIASYDLVLQHTRRLEQAIRDLPPSFKLGPGNDEASDTTHRLIAQMEMDFCLRRPLNACYATYGSLMPADDRYKEARIPWIQSCTVSICFQDLFDPKYPMLDLPEPRGLWDYFFNTHYWDTEQYLLANCLELQRLRSSGPDEPDAPSPAFHTHNMRTPITVKGWSIDSITKSLEDTIDPMTRRIGRRGSNLRQVVRWTAVIGSLRVNPSCSRLHAIKNELQSLISALKPKLLTTDKRKTRPGRQISVDKAREGLEWLREYLLQDTCDEDIEM